MAGRDAAYYPAKKQVILGITISCLFVAYYSKYSVIRLAFIWWGDKGYRFTYYS